ncbi:redox-regulated ATPase YchF [bacterium]
MALSIGIVGLPNVGKSTLFNAITNCQADVQNYPFCTIEPNTGIVPVPDKRLDILAKISGTQKIVPATITFVDIAGLVKGASKGEGLGNKFLANIREVSAIAHVVRCFKDEDVVHVDGKFDPLNDIEVINLELVFSDLEMAEKMAANLERKVKHVKDSEDKERFELLLRVKEVLEDNKPIRALDLTEKEIKLVNSMNFLTVKKVIYIANISENDIGKDLPQLEAIKKYAKDHGDEFAVISAKIEEEISELGQEEKDEYLKELGIEMSGLDTIAKNCFDLLGLQTYLTTGVKETRAWTIKKGATAPEAAGVIHTDFQKGFIRANIISYDDFVAFGGLKGAKEKGVLRQEGRDYIMRDGDVVEFLFNV